MGLARLSGQAITAIDKLKRQRRPAASQTLGNQSLSPRGIYLARMLTPLVPGVADTEPSANTAQAVLLTADDDTDPPEDREPLKAEITAQPDETTIVIAGDWSLWLKDLSRIRIGGSEDDNGEHELNGDPTYDSDEDETTFTLARELKGDVVEATLFRDGPDTLQKQSTVVSISGHATVAAFPDDIILIARVGLEYVAVTGSQTLFGLVTKAITEPVILTDDPATDDLDETDLVTLGTGQIEVYYPEQQKRPDGTVLPGGFTWRRSTGITLDVYNDAEGLNVLTNVAVRCDWCAGRWMLSQVSCSATAGVLL